MCYLVAKDRNAHGCFALKMTRRTAKRPAVRVRWEFSDTPYKTGSA